MDYLSHLDSDYRRLAEVSEGHLADRVPTCPDWTVDDLVRHVALVYLHKVEAMRRNEFPDPWPPDFSAEPALELLSRSHSALLAEFAQRDVKDQTRTWYEPDQSVGFWVRRMAQETVIHRIDGELAAGVPSTPIPDDLALDGIDEMLRVFLAWQSIKWHEEFVEPLSKGDGSVLVRAGAANWLVAWDSAGVRAWADPDSPTPDATITGSPNAVLRWLWRRANDDVIDIAGGVGQGPHPWPRSASADHAGELQGRDKVAQLRALLGPATQ